MPRGTAPAHPSLEGCAGAALGFTVSYLVVEAAMAGPLHPVHWLVAGLGGALGYAVGHGILLMNERRRWGPPRSGRQHHAGPRYHQSRRRSRRR